MNCLWCFKKNNTACHWKKKKLLIKVISRKQWKWTTINLFLLLSITLLAHHCRIVLQELLMDAPAEHAQLCPHPADEEDCSPHVPVFSPALFPLWADSSKSPPGCSAGSTGFSGERHPPWKPRRVFSALVCTQQMISAPDQSREPSSGGTAESHASNGFLGGQRHSFRRSKALTQALTL